MGLRLKIFLPLVVSAGLLAVYISLVWIPDFLDDEREHWLQHLEAHLDTLGDGLVEPLLKNDLAVVHTTLNSVLARNPPWKVLRLVGSQGKEIYRRMEAEPRDDPEGYFRITQPVSYLGRDLAVLELTADFSARAVEDAKHVYGLGWALFVLLTVAVFLAGGALELLVRRPVIRLVQAVGQLARGDFDAPLPLPPPGRDEIGQLVAGFTSMRSRLADDWHALEAEIAERRHAEEALLKETSLKELLQRATTAANEASDLDDAMQACLDEVCGMTGWPVGHAYITDTEAPGTLRSTRLWHLDEPERYQEFREVTEATVFFAGEGLPGRVYASGAPAWLVDVGEANPEDYRRAPVAGEAGIHAVFAFPVLIGQEVVAVLEFCTDETSEPDKALLDATTHIGIQLGRVLERRRAEEVLQASEERFRNLLETSHDWVWEVNQDTVYTYASPRVRDLLGYEPEEVLGKSPFDLMSPQEAKRVAEIFGPIADAREPFSLLKNINLHKEGHPVVLESSGVPYYDGEGQFCGYRGIDRDITYRERTEEALIKQAQIIDQIHDSVVSTDLEGFVTSWNKGAERLFGYTAREALGRPISFVYPPEEHAFLENKVIAPLKEKGAHEVEVRMRRKTGEDFFVHLATSLQKDNNGNVTGMIGYSMDITARKRTEDALRRSEERFALAVLGTNDGIWDWDLGKGEIYFSPRWKAMLGYGEDELANTFLQLQQLIHPDDFGDVLMAWLDCMEGKTESFCTDYRMLADGGNYLWVQCRGLALHDAEGNPVRLAGSQTDISERKRAEALLQRSNEGLEQEVQKRVAEIHEMNKKLLLEVAERRYAEEKIKASEVELRAILDSMQDTFYRTDAEGRLVRVSSSVNQLLGYSVEEVLGRKMAEFYFDPETREDFMRELKDRGGAYLDHRARLVRKDGGVIWVSTNTQYYYDTSGNILGVEGTARDITRSMQAEAAMRQSEERFSKVFHASGANISIATLEEGRFVDVNDSFLKGSGYTREEVVGHTSDELGLWVDWDGRAGFIEELRRRGSLHEVELKVRTKSGEVRDTLISMELVDIGGEPCILAVSQDLTERNRMLDVLNRTMAELEDQKFALDQHAIVAITDRQGHITYANDKFCEISQYSRQELLGQDHRIINSGWHPKSFFKKMWATIGRGRVWKGEVKNRRKDGSIYWVDATIVPFKDERGKPCEYVAIRTDITERKQVEEDLVQARDRALAASRLKSEFVANMSHEIRTPLNGVVGMAGLLMETKLDEEQHGFAEIMLDSATHLTAIINDILDYSKIAAGELRIEALDYDPRDLIKHLTRPLAEQARGKGLTLTVSIAPDVPAMVHGDPTRLRQILTNLVANAVKFTERGEVEVNVGVVSQHEAEVDGRPLEMVHGTEFTAPGSKSLNTGHRPPATDLLFLRFEVRDTGIGVAPDDGPRVFEAFRQADGSTSRRYGGTGLGLAISRHLVEAMGGDIGLESRLGEGSLFWFTLPFDSRAAVPAAPTPAVVDDSGRIPASRERSAHILVVEDNAVNQKVVVHMLRRLGCCADVAGNGRDALRALARADYDIVFMDCQMPELDGYEATRIIRQREQANDGTGRAVFGPATRKSRLATRIPIIAMTAHAMEGSREKCRASGMDDYLAKPLNLEVLRAILERWLPENGQVAGIG